jgi:hypothetical protein
MSSTHICQSCSLPIETADMKGTEKNGSKSSMYCQYCYLDGDFTTPKITLNEMKAVVSDQINSMKLPIDLKTEMIELSEKLLPGLERWK